MKNLKLPDHYIYIGDEPRVVKDPITQKERTKKFHVIMEKGTQEFYLVDRVTGGTMKYETNLIKKDHLKEAL